MSSTEFTTDTRDIRFVLHEQLDIAGTFQKYDAFAEYDQEMYDSMIDEAEKIAKEVLAPLNKVGDEHGVSFDGRGNVTTPPGFKDAWEILAGGGVFGEHPGDRPKGRRTDQRLGRPLGSRRSARVRRISPSSHERP